MAAEAVGRRSLLLLKSEAVWLGHACGDVCR